MIRLTLEEILSLPCGGNVSFQIINSTNAGVVMGVVLYMDRGWHAQSFYVAKDHPRYYEAISRVYDQ